MNKENLDLLKNILRGLEFADDPELFEQLDKAISEGYTKFLLNTKAHFDEFTTLEALIYVYKSDQDNRYHVTKYDCTLLYKANPLTCRTNSFFINNDEGVSFKEAFNLLQGRSVYKHLKSSAEGRYYAWMKLDFDKRDAYSNYAIRQFRADYGFDLEKVLRHYPIDELTDEITKATLLTALQRGDLHPVTFVKTKKTEKMLIEANPPFKTINIYPANESFKPSKITPKNRDGHY